MKTIVGTREEIIRELNVQSTNECIGVLYVEGARVETNSNNSIRKQLDAIEKMMSRIIEEGENVEGIEKNSVVNYLVIDKSNYIKGIPDINLRFTSTPVRIISQEESDRRKLEMEELLEKIL